MKYFAISKYRKTFSETQISQMIAGYSQGKTTYELAGTITKTLRKAGVNVTKAKVQKSLDANDVVKMYKEYHTIAEIGKNIVLALAP